METGIVKRVSANNDKGEANRPSSAPSISGDGRLVAFSSSASNLVVGDTNGVSDIFAHVSALLLPLTVSIQGSGRLTSTPVGLDCSEKCAATFPVGQSVSLNFISAAGQSFQGWGGDCNGAAGCMVTMTTSHAVTASFGSMGYSLSPTSQTVKHTDGSVTVAIGRSGVGNLPQETVYASTLAGGSYSANDSDYTPLVNSPLTFAAGATSTSLPMTITLNAAKASPGVPAKTFGVTVRQSPLSSRLALATFKIYDPRLPTTYSLTDVSPENSARNG
jgi:hypothetical protein